MRRIREVLRLYHECGLSQRQIAQSCRVGKTTVRDCIARAEDAGLSWPLAADVDDAALEARLYPGPGRRDAARGEPDWAWVERELARKGVTRRQLWLEYRAAHPAGYDYSWFCAHYARHRARREPTMRQPRPAGEAMFVDYAGQGNSGDGCRSRRRYTSENQSGSWRL
ncbi:MAG: hypothetical protein U5K43_14070 [Halofilum sp. (in: g-proteobacteria)]|nr:hypothetical protein [Halofilum sp. (in: g-proteobacteria)]